MHEPGQWRSLPDRAENRPRRTDRGRLRADAATTAVREALTGIQGIHEVAAGTEDAATVVSVTLTASADVRAVQHILGRDPLAYRITQHP